MRILTNLLFLVFCVVSTSVYAGNSKMVKVDLDVDTTVLVKADLDQDDLYYYIDTAACNCFLRIVDKNYSGIASVDCAGLAKHKLLEPHVANCQKQAAKVELSDASIQAIANAMRSTGTAAASPAPTDIEAAKTESESEAE